ncbi:YczE/YyaS/YitT family protein [Franconibacter pulveris 1160]|uniref:membrane protein YczE n=1 Tax=Franconibacter pulveris TaxID=435910 RepID=UPI0004670D89|nr:membrane protein [Franconibacter pulveris]
MVRRLIQLYTGLVLYGVSTAMFVRADLGADPWNVFHLGVARIFSLNIGMVMILVGALVLLLWIPLRQRPGLGTVSNVVVLGLAADAALAVMPPMESLVARGVLLAAAVAVNAIATGMYIGAGFGAGPRDGLMTGIHARTGWSVRSIRTAIEVTVLLAGWAMGGTFGAGTVLYALTIGPLIQLCLLWFRVVPAAPAPARQTI